ncbi:helix-turn-helix domain-containing protein [Streptomyces nodosus]
MRRRLAAAGLVVSAGKMSALWSGLPVSVRLDDLEVVCRVLGCGPSDVLVRDHAAPAASGAAPLPAPVPASVPAVAVGSGRAVAGGPGGGRGRVAVPAAAAAVNTAAAAVAGGGGRRRVRCAVCGKRPPTMKGVEFCFSCWPGGPVVAPPCLRCGSRTRYWARGLCERCHPSAGAAVLLESCTDCLAWGVTRTRGWLCSRCRHGRGTASGICTVCGRSARCDRQGVCSLCRDQSAFTGPAAAGAAVSKARETVRR